jgi:DNA helicase II / ATP-dependent DNA helicase PcrA
LITGKEKIIISTVYKAKGLEFANVIIPECVTNVYPSFSSETDEQKKEDARALYVAISRAKRKLILTTHSSSVNRFGKCFPREKSPFLRCIEKHFISISV